jgi:hypothetical protein
MILCVWLYFSKKTARFHDTITRESDELVPLSPWTWTCSSVYSHRQRERVATQYRDQERIQPLKTLRCRNNDETRHIGFQKGWPGKADVLDDLQKISCQWLTTVRRYTWLWFLLGSPRVLTYSIPEVPTNCLQCLQTPACCQGTTYLSQVSETD